VFSSLRLWAAVKRMHMKRFRQLDFFVKFFGICFRNTCDILDYFLVVITELFCKSC